MATYRSKPITCEAMQWSGTNEPAIEEWMRQSLTITGGVLSFWVEKAQSHIGIVHGDYIIKESDGDGFYPCNYTAFNTRWEAI